MRLESDEQGADSRLIANFYVRAVQNNFKTEQEGRPIFEDIDYVKIFIPGDSLNILDQPVREDHKTRFPRQWAHFLNQKEGDQREVGTPVTSWPRISVSMAEELKALKFFTVESIANASDAMITKLGMIAGKSPYAFREDAQRFLKLASDDAEVSRMEEKTKSLEAQVAEMKAMLESLTNPKEETKKGK